MKLLNAKTAWTRNTNAFCLGKNEASEYCDVIFQCDGGQEVYALKGILAIHSPFFRSQFFGHMSESETIKNGILTIQVPWEFDSFQALVSFCHTGIMEVEHKTVIDLLLLADYYGMISLLNHLSNLIIDGENYNDQNIQPITKFEQVEDFDVDENNDFNFRLHNQNVQNTVVDQPFNHDKLNNDNGLCLECPLVNRENVLGVLECACRARHAELRDFCLNILEPDMSPALLEDLGNVILTSSENESLLNNNNNNNVSSSLSSKSCLGNLSIDVFCTILIRDELCMEEIDIFRAVLRWGRLQLLQYKQGQEEEIVEDLYEEKEVILLKSIIKRPLKLVRFSQIPPKLLVGEVQSSGFVDSSIIIEALGHIADPTITVPSDQTPYLNLKNNTNQHRTPSIIHIRDKKPPQLSSIGWGDEEECEKNSAFKYRPRHSMPLSQSMWTPVDGIASVPLGLIDYHRFVISTNYHRPNSSSSTRVETDSRRNYLREGGGGGDDNDDDIDDGDSGEVVAGDLRLNESIHQLVPGSHQPLVPPNLALTQQQNNPTLPRLSDPNATFNDLNRRRAARAAAESINKGEVGRGGIWAPSTSHTPWLQRLRLSPQLPQAPLPPRTQLQSANNTAVNGGGIPGQPDSTKGISSEQLIAYLKNSGVPVQHVETQGPQSSYIQQPPAIPSSRHTDATLARLEQLEADFDSAIQSTTARGQQGRK